MTYTVATANGSRPVNEDSAGAFSFGGKSCYMVADGLGGHGKGDIASQMAVQSFQWVFSQETGSLEELLSKGFQEAQRAILAEQTRLGCPHQMKTTVVALATDGEKVAWGHVGDSRLYAFSKNKVKVRTMDHSVPQMLVLAKEIKEKEIRNHPDRNKLLRVLGIAGDSPRYEIEEESDLADYQAFLMCSDGFWELILEKEMCTTLKKSATVEEWVQRMAEIVNERGKGKDMDNNTAVAVWV